MTKIAPLGLQKKTHRNVLWLASRTMFCDARRITEKEESTEATEKRGKISLFFPLWPQ